MPFLHGALQLIILLFAGNCVIMNWTDNNKLAPVFDSFCLQSNSC